MKPEGAGAARGRTQPAEPLATIYPAATPAPRWLMPACALSTLAFTIFCLHIPISLRADQIFDDALFMQHAQSLLAGQWLGAFDDRTLAKGPGFSFFLALNCLLGVPVTLSLALLYSAACTLTAFTLFRLLGRPWFSLVTFLSMQWHPAMVPTVIIRDDVSAAQVLLILACLCQAVFIRHRPSVRLAWGVASGLALAWFWMTREDAIWLLPGPGLIILLQICRLWPWPKELARLAVPATGLVLAAGSALALVALINLKLYGGFAISDFKSPDFMRALNSLQSVEVGPSVPHVPVPLKVRAALDEASPSFASLELYFKGPGLGWEQPGCAVYPATCGDIAGGWFVWAFRDAVAFAGHYQNERTANAFYRKLWREVRSACAAGALHCHASALSLMPPIQRQQWAQIPPTALTLFRLATWWHGENLNPGPIRYFSTGSAAQVQSMDLLLRRPLREPTQAEYGQMSASGWFLGDGEWIQLHCTADTGDAIFSILREPSPDLVLAFHNPRATMQRFSLTAPSGSACWLEPIGGKERLSIGALQRGISHFAGGLLGIDNLTPVHGALPGKGAFAMLIRISRFYSALIPPALLLAAGLYLAALFRAAGRDWRRRLDASLILVTAILAMLFARAVILILVSISSFPAISLLYWSACFPLLMLAILLALAQGFWLLAPFTGEIRASDRTGSGLPSSRN